MLFYKTHLMCKIRKTVLTKDSMIFEIQGNTEIGRLSSQSVGEPPLDSGTTLAIFQTDRNKPVRSDSLKK